ncbi:MAG: hypothetical protein LBL90_11440 [Prevotellaceae bacterium]|jgi:tetratricopeptide (TPR) repeat protein|nr:hypothetical protein [Prevotellaceae bacterium]
MRVLKLVMIVPLLFMFFNNKAQAQGGKFGATAQDSIECIKNLNFYEEEYKRKNYDAAYGPWREAMRICPKSSTNLYVRGAVIMRDRIGKLTDASQKQAAIDSLLMVYDKRMEYFNVNKADLMYRKADIIEEFYASDNQKVYDAYLAVIESDKQKGEIMAAAKAMIEAQKMYDAQKIDADKFTDIYTKLSEIVDERIKIISRATNIDTIVLQDAQDCKSAIENAFISTDAANCDNLIKLFTPRFQDNKENITTVGMIVNILLNRECIQNDLFYDAAEAYYKLDPAPKSASTLAAMFMSKGETDKAIQYYKDAIDGQTNAMEKSLYQTTLAGILFQQGQTGQAMTYANHAIQSNPRNGKAYMILGNIYAGIKGCGNDPVSQRSVFWVAVDMLQKAKQVGGSDTKFVDDVNRQINLFRQHFPSYDDCFDLDILDGQPYTVNCGGINVKTIVRTHK